MKINDDTLMVQNLLRHKQRLETERKDYDINGDRQSEAEGHNQRRRITMLKAINTILVEFEALSNCGTCAHYDNVTHGYGTCIAPLPVAIRGVDIRSRPMFTTDGEDCQCWKKRS